MSDAPATAPMDPRIKRAFLFMVAIDVVFFGAAIAVYLLTGQRVLAYVIGAPALIIGPLLLFRALKASQVKDALTRPGNLVQ